MFLLPPTARPFRRAGYSVFGQPEMLQTKVNEDELQVGFIIGSAWTADD